MNGLPCGTLVYKRTPWNGDAEGVVLAVYGVNGLVPVNRLRMLKVVWWIQSVLCLLCAVSQTHASEQIEDVGMQVVGWYHSHPTFAPNPSVRDIETQQKFQVSYKYKV